jgi:hypothetical protein
VPTRDHTVAEQSENYRYSTSRQVVVDGDTRLAVALGRPLPGNRNVCRAWGESGTKDAVGKTVTIADGGYRERDWSSLTAVAARTKNSPTGSRRATRAPGRSGPASTTSLPA